MKSNNRILVEIDKIYDNEKTIKDAEGKDIKILTDAEDGFLNGKRYVLMDRDGKFCPAFRDILEQEGINCVRLPPRSPNASFWNIITPRETIKDWAVN